MITPDSSYSILGRNLKSVNSTCVSYISFNTYFSLSNFCNMEDEGLRSRILSRDSPTMSKEGENKEEIKDSEKFSQGSQKVLVDDESIEKGSSICCAPEEKIYITIVRLFACLCAGIVFGIAAEKCRVFEPATIRGQMVMKRWIMLKMFLAAMATSQFCFALMSVIPITKQKFQEALDSFTPCFTDKGILTTVLGASILGCGMTLSGACPGMILPQVGSWTKNAIYTYVGCLIGALVYGMLAPILIKALKPKHSIEKHQLTQHLKLPFAAIAFPMSILILMLVFLMEYYIPWQDDLLEPKVNDGKRNIFTYVAWPPAIGGVLIGLLQPLILYAVGDTLGGSTSYVTIVSQWVCTKKLKEIFPYLAKYRCGIGNWWQVFYIFSAMIGALLSAFASETIRYTKGVNLPYALCGGFLIIFGARLAAGCTSGHGLSGMGMMYMLSIVAVPAMFGGGIVTGFIMQATGSLNDYDCYGDMLESVCSRT